MINWTVVVEVLTLLHSFNGLRKFYQHEKKNTQKAAHLWCLLNKWPKPFRPSATYSPSVKASVCFKQSVSIRLTASEAPFQMAELMAVLDKLCKEQVNQMQPGWGYDGRLFRTGRNT